MTSLTIDFLNPAHNLVASFAVLAIILTVINAEWNGFLTFITGFLLLICGASIVGNLLWLLSKSL